MAKNPSWGYALYYNAVRLLDAAKISFIDIWWHYL